PHPPAPTVYYTLSLHDALPISEKPHPIDLVTTESRTLGIVADNSDTRPNESQPDLPLARNPDPEDIKQEAAPPSKHKSNPRWTKDRKSTRLNSSHLGISYAVFC